MKRALIFDMDGVLVDSMHLHAAAWKMAFMEVGISLTEELIFNIEGANDRGIVENVLREQGLNGVYEDFNSIPPRKQELFNILKVRPFSGIEDCLNMLSDEYLLAVVSGSDRGAVEKIISRHFKVKFDAVVSGDDVIQGKPHPDPYEKAVDYLGVDRNNCTVFENAPYGVEAAKRAGIYCIGIPTYVDSRLLNRADIVLKDHSDLLAYLQGLAGR